MLVLSKDELEKFAKTVDSHLIYDVKKHSVLPENNKNNVIDLGRLTPNDLEIVDLNNRERCEKLIKKGFVTVSFCDNPDSLCFISGTKILMRNGEYKSVDDLKVGDLLMCTSHVEPLEHVGEVKNVFSTMLDYDPKENYNVNFVDVVTSENYEYSRLFIKSDAYDD